MTFETGLIIICFVTTLVWGIYNTFLYDALEDKINHIEDHIKWQDNEREQLRQRTAENEKKLEKASRSDKKPKPKKRGMRNDARYDEVERLLNSGMKEPDVVNATGVSKSTVYRIHRRLRERLFKQYIKDKENGINNPADNEGVLQFGDDAI